MSRRDPFMSFSQRQTYGVADKSEAEARRTYGLAKLSGEVKTHATSHLQRVGPINLMELHA